MTTAEAYEVCQRLAASHYENFPVASLLLPPAMRPHVAAVYAFARTADDFADEEGYETGERLALLDWWHARLRACAGSGEDAPPVIGAEWRPRSESAGAIPAEAIFTALGETIHARDLPVGLLADLLSAFRQDVTTKRYDTWRDVFDYCRRSANPVGRLVLRVAGYRDAALDESSDALCTALQLTNFWQDLAIDWNRGRLYLPAEEWQRAGARLDDLDRGAVTAPWRAALASAADRTRALFDDGRMVCDGVRGRLRYELRLTWLSATRVLQRLERAGFDAFHTRPALGLPDAGPLLWHTLTWRSRAQPPARTRPHAATREP